jgi:hypothetical protein
VKQFFILILSFLSFFNYSQTEKELEGHWTFKNTYFISGKQMENKEQVISALKSIDMNFYADNRYQATIQGKNEKGIWKITEKAIEFVNDKGQTYSVIIIGYKENELTLQLDTDVAIVFQRIK